MKEEKVFHEGETTAFLFNHGQLCDMTVRMWSNFMDTAVLLPRDNLPLGSPVTDPGSKKSNIKKK